MQPDAQRLVCLCIWSVKCKDYCGCIFRNVLLLTLSLFLFRSGQCHETESTTSPVICKYCNICLFNLVLHFVSMLKPSLKGLRLLYMSFLVVKWLVDHPDLVPSWLKLLMRPCCSKACLHSSRWAASAYFGLGQGEGCWVIMFFFCFCADLF